MSTQMAAKAAQNQIAPRTPRAYRQLKNHGEATRLDGSRAFERDVNRREMTRDARYKKSTGNEWSRLWKLGNRLAGERDQFLRTIEQEVVRLALAIAARILRREAQTDPLFLVGAVRVALGQLAATMQVRLRVPAEESVLGPRRWRIYQSQSEADSRSR